MSTSREARQHVRYVTATDGTRLAWAASGAGQVVVKAANWLTHLDHDRETFVWRHWLEGLARNRTLIRYDERGCGMSDWDVDSFELDDWVDDLEMVVDAAGLERFPLLGVSQGSVREAQLLVMRWNGGEPGATPTVFVGKGVTFDTGGISIKPAQGQYYTLIVGFQLDDEELKRLEQPLLR